VFCALRLVVVVVVGGGGGGGTLIFLFFLKPTGMPRKYGTPY
jgi:hypothetical protein